MTSGSSKSLTAGTSYYTLVVKASTSKNGTQSYTIKANFVKAPTATINVGISSGGPTKGKVFVSASTTQGTSTSVTQYATALAAQSKTFYLFAVPDDGYEFVGWAKNNASATTADAGLTTQTAQKVTLSTGSTAGSTASATYYAIFKAKQTKATVNVAKTGEGSIHVSQTTTEGTSTSETYTSENKSDPRTFYIFANPNPDHYVLQNWTKVPESAPTPTKSAGNDYYTVNVTTADTYGKENIYSYTANFKQLKHYQYNVNAVATYDGAISTEAGSVTCSVNKTEAWAKTLSQQADTAKATFTATANPGYIFSGWSYTNDGTVDIYGNPLNEWPIINTAGGTMNYTLYAVFFSSIDPTAAVITPTSVTLDKGNTQQISIDFTPAKCYKKVLYTSSDGTVATVSTSGLITGVKPGKAEITVTVYTVEGKVFKTQTIPVTVMGTLQNPTIEFEQIEGTTQVTITIEKAEETPDSAVIRYTVNGAAPTEASTIYTAPFTANALDTIKAIVTCNDWHSSGVVSKLIALKKTKTPNITIKRSQNNLVTLTCSDSDVTIWYTTNGDTPVPNPTSAKQGAKPISKAGGSTQEYTGPFTPDSLHCVIKAVATHAGWLNSDVAVDDYYHGSQVANGMVFINDLEDHRWTYYTGVDETVDDGYYNTTYKNKLYFPDPRNVKITYNGGTVSGCSYTASVSKNETETSFVYLKTLSQTFTTAGAATGNYAYKVIPNPFSRRPKSGSTYYGFNGWKIVSGGEYISGHNNGDVLTTLEDEITFTNLPYPSVNSISAEIVFEADWQTANVVTCAASAVNDNLTSSSLNSSYTYERNFIVVNSGNSTTNLTATGAKAVTITSVTPDGETDYRSSSCYLNPLVVTLSNAWKFEYINFNGTVGDNLTGDYWSMTGSKSTMIYANMKNLTIGRGVDNTSAGGIVAYQIVGYNTAAASGMSYNTSGGNFNYHMRIESGNYHFLAVTQNWNFTYYPGINTCKATYGCDYDRAKGDNEKFKIRRRVYGGNGTGFTDSGNNDRETIIHVMKSGQLGCDLEVGNGDLNNGSNTQFNATTYFGVIGYHCYNYVTSQPSYTGVRSFYMEGGIAGNLVGGCDKNGGTTNANESVRVRMTGGRVRGALYGAATQTWSKGNRRMVVLGGTVEGWVAGGANGTSADAAADGEVDGTSFMYVGGDAELRSNNTTVINRAVGGNLFGAGCGMTATSTSGEMVNGTNVVVADDATIERGVYGGGSYGFTKSTANIIITGGRIGGNVGGVNGTTYDASIQGGVYGGSALGTVNTNTSNHTNVTLNGGTIYGSIYGGALGSSSVAANVKGPVQVKVYGGSVKKTSVLGSGGVYGCNNVNGTPQSTVAVDVYGTDPAVSKDEYALYSVYGGGNQSAYTGTPKVTVHNCTNSIEYVYGGGNAAAVNGTDVTIWGGDIIGNVFGGGNGSSEGWPEGQTNPGANITSSGVKVKINGGTILNVFGGSNTKGTINGGINVTVNQQKESEETGCVECPVLADSVFGGGNLAPYTGDTYVNVLNGTVGNVFGGGKLATVTGNSNVVIGDWVEGHQVTVTGNVFGGGDKAQLTNGANVTVNNCATLIMGDVYGGGNNANVIGNTNVQIGPKK